jgi:hypothetical protein
LRIGFRSSAGQLRGKRLLEWAVFIGTDDQNGHWCEADDLLGAAAQQHPTDPAAPVGAQHDEIGAVGGHFLVDGFGQTLTGRLDQALIGRDALQILRCPVPCSGPVDRCRA